MHRAIERLRRPPRPYPPVPAAGRHPKGLPATWSWTDERRGLRSVVFAGTLALVSGLLSGAGAFVASAQAAPLCSGTTTVTCEFFPIGAAQQFTVPSNVNQVRIDAIGAPGGQGTDGTLGGNGGEAKATIDVSPGDTIQVNVGGQPLGVANPSPGGFNGGGPGGPGDTTIIGNPLGEARAGRRGGRGVRRPLGRHGA